MFIGRKYQILGVKKHLHFRSFTLSIINWTPRRQAFAFSGGPLSFSLQRSFRERSPITLISTMVFIVYNYIET